MWPFSRRGASGFNWHSTAEEVTEGLDGSGLTAIVTGASSGIGTETSRVLAMRGVHVIMAVRSLSAGTNVKDSIVQEIPAAKLNVMELDLSSMASVRNFSSEFSALDLPLNILINNAGIAAPPFLLSQDGIELQFATNHIGHFLLTHLLLENMKDTARKSKIEGRIINVSSEVHRLFTYREGIRFDKINDQSEYSSWRAYGQSKLANVLHANELCRHFKEEEIDITANSLHPGTITTNSLRHQSFVRFICYTLGGLFVKNVQQGAATTCYIALHPQVKGVTGKYFIDSNIVEPSAQAKDTELAKKLWDFSINLIS